MARMIYSGVTYSNPRRRNAGGGEADRQRSFASEEAERERRYRADAERYRQRMSAERQQAQLTHEGTARQEQIRGNVATALAGQGKGVPRSLLPGQGQGGAESPASPPEDPRNSFLRQQGIRVGTPYADADRAEWYKRARMLRELEQAKPKPVGTIDYVGPGGEQYQGPGPGMVQTPEQGEQYGTAMVRGTQRMNRFRQEARASGTGVRGMEYLSGYQSPHGGRTQAGETPEGTVQRGREAGYLAQPGESEADRRGRYEDMLFRGGERVFAESGAGTPEDRAQAELNAMGVQAPQAQQMPQGGGSPMLQSMLAAAAMGATPQRPEPQPIRPEGPQRPPQDQIDLANRLAGQGDKTAVEWLQVYGLSPAASFPPNPNAGTLAMGPMNPPPTDMGRLDQMLGAERQRLGATYGTAPAAPAPAPPRPLPDTGGLGTDQWQHIRDRLTQIGVASQPIEEGLMPGVPPEQAVPYRVPESYGLNVAGMPMEIPSAYAGMSAPAAREAWRARQQYLQQGSMPSELVTSGQKKPEQMDAYQADLQKRIAESRAASAAAMAPTMRPEEETIGGPSEYDRSMQALTRRKAEQDLLKGSEQIKGASAERGEIERKQAGDRISGIDMTALAGADTKLGLDVISADEARSASDLRNSVKSMNLTQPEAQLFLDRHQGSIQRAIRTAKGVIAAGKASKIGPISGTGIAGMAIGGLTRPQDRDAYVKSLESLLAEVKSVANRKS